MVNYTLQTLTNIIRKCCKVENETGNIDDRYSFILDTSKLQTKLDQKKTNLNVIGFEKIVKSRKVTVKDIQLISEYIHDTKIFNNIFKNGKTEFVSFMLFSTVNEEGNIEIVLQDDSESKKTGSKEDIYKICNIDTNTDDTEEFFEKYADQFIIDVTNQLPCYRVIVVRMYNYSEDKFEYKVMIRSNYNMVTFQKSIKEETESDK